MAVLETFWIGLASKYLDINFADPCVRRHRRKMGSRVLRFGKSFFCLGVGVVFVAAFLLISSHRHQAFARELVNWEGGHGMGAIALSSIGCAPLAAVPGCKIAT